MASAPEATRQLSLHRPAVRTPSAPLTPDSHSFRPLATRLQSLPLQTHDNIFHRSGLPKNWSGRRGCSRISLLSTIHDIDEDKTDEKEKQNECRPKRVDLMTAEEIRSELDSFLKHPDFLRPDRSTIDANRPWLHGMPNYDAVDLTFFRGKTRSHSAASLAGMVENSIKSWDLEASHLAFKDWVSVDRERYAVSANGGRRFTGEEADNVGTHNWLMENVDKKIYDATKHTKESSVAIFRKAFPGGFPWEVLEVFSGPPRVAFSWRHWADFEGEFEGRKGDGKTYQMYGFGLVDLDDELRIKEIEIYYKPTDFLKALHGELPVERLTNGKSLVGSSCPIASITLK